MTQSLPRLPLRGGIDLTYRCNNNCRHCWLVEPDRGDVRASELSTQEWIDIIDQARAMGAREWAISGGEPILREDFVELFDYITAKAASYSLNTNGTLISPSIAQKLRRPGDIMVAVYGATVEVHDHITRNPGSFEQTMRGMAYLREAGVPFTVQLIPMKDNFHQWTEMNQLALRLSSRRRVGASGLSLSAAGDTSRNDEIRAQRLTPAQVIMFDPPNVPYDEWHAKNVMPDIRNEGSEYSHCALNRDTFHVDPRGGLSLCILIKDERLRHDLKKGSFADGWERVLPASVRTDRNAASGRQCDRCGFREGCHRCPALNYLEQRTARAPVNYLCQLEEEKQKYRRQWKVHHQRYFQIAGMTVNFNTEQPIKDGTFGPCFENFMVDQPGDDVIQLEHFFSFPDWNEKSLGKPVYEQAPWLIYRKDDAFAYVEFVENDSLKSFEKIAVFTSNYSHGRIFNRSDFTFRHGGLHSLSMFPSDQIWLAQTLLHRQAFFVHSCGLMVDGQGLLFVGHSEAGKSTTAKMFGGQAELLCDDRNILRHWPGQGWRVHGSWSHGEIARVSAASAPLKGLFFLEKSEENSLTRILDPNEIRQMLVPCLVRPFVDTRWWEMILPLVFQLSKSIPAYRMRFDRSGAIVPLIRGICSKSGLEEPLCQKTGT